MALLRIVVTWLYREKRGHVYTEGKGVHGYNVGQVDMALQMEREYMAILREMRDISILM